MARTIRTKIYKFNELSKAAKEKAIEWWRTDEDFSNVYDEAAESLKKFCEVFLIKLRDYDFEEPYRSRYTFELDDTILDLTGQRLATYIWNNYKTDIYKPKYIGNIEADRQFFHQRVKSEKLTNKHRRKEWFNSYYSGYKIDCDCPFTGCSWDYDLLDPILNFMDRPSDRLDFKDLLEECLSSLNKSVQGEVKAQSENDFISEMIEQNEYEFLKDGTKY